METACNRYRPHVTVEPNSRDEEELQCHDNYAVFAVSAFQYITLAVVFSRGRPYRRTILSNYLFTLSLVVMTAISLYLVLYPADFLIDIFELAIRDTDIGFRILCVVIAVSHFVVAYVLENYFVQGFLFRQVQMRFCSGSPPYRELQEELKDHSPWMPLSRESSITSAPSSKDEGSLRPLCALELQYQQGDAPRDHDKASGRDLPAVAASMGGGKRRGSSENDCAPYVTHM